MAPFGASRAGLMSVAEDDIPDSGLLHDYNIEDLNLTDGEAIETVPDSVGSEDLSVVGSPTYRTEQFNGFDVAELDGDADGLKSAFSRSQPIVWFIVGDTADQGSDNATIVGNGSGDTFFAREEWDDSEYRFFAGGTGQVGGSLTAGQTLYTVKSDGANSELRRNASVEVSGDIGNNQITDASYGYRGELESQHNNIDIVRILAYDGNEIDDINEVEQILNDKYEVFD